MDTRSAKVREDTDEVFHLERLGEDTREAVFTVVGEHAVVEVASGDDCFDVGVLLFEGCECFLDAVVDRDKVKVVAFLRRLYEELHFRERLTASNVESV